MDSPNTQQRAFEKAVFAFLRSKRNAADLRQYSVACIVASRYLDWNLIEQIVSEVGADNYTLRVLYIEDEEMIANAMKRWLSARQCHVTHTASANKAVQLLKKQDADFDVVLTDWNLIGGETGDALALEATTRKLPVRIYSGSLCADPAWHEIWLTKGRNDQLDDFLTKLRHFEDRR